ncbi:TonB-linked SusC/RagA family outer membrane protein [Chitinophaga niastensis]|uniref:TonB-linked SusC/RagA family outer membrane protein n=1 Tax=Chitinophaga niastensis TaxID=536980 RepID=A0A2P8HPQ8_CHINA|nr:SusC/RagA family TonB-linked outer membrane protein [Chitinophaga niastensis]PSL48213.1 TonB-linked SusC/RagA family outer membrane protein [Chitinophaga niastensis]
MGIIFKTRHIVFVLAALVVSLHFYSPLAAQETGDQKITVFANNTPLRSVLKNIEKQTDMRFNYIDNELNVNEKVTVRYENLPLNSVMSALLHPKGLAWKYIDKNIYLRKNNDAEKKENAPVGSKDTIRSSAISGKIVDEEGAPLPGATVLVKGTPLGTSADAEGRFFLSNVPDNANLRISYTSYEPQELHVKVKQNFKVILKKIIGNLDEMVVIAYGATTKRFNTGSVSTVKAEDIEKQPVTDPIMALQGRVSGLYITQSSGIPGAGLTVRLRGQNSIANGNDPLYIVDGIPYTSTTLTSPDFGGGAVGGPPDQGGGLSPFNSLNPADIERIDVLKDADATAIYGSRGANGVILITTKKGKAGKTKFDLNISTGNGQVPHMMKLLNTQQYLEMRHEAFKNDGVIPGSSDYDINGAWDTTHYTNWQKVLIGGTAKFTNIQTSLSGGNQHTQFIIGGGYSKQTTVYPGDYYNQKASLHINLTHSSINEKFRLNFSGSYVNDDSNLPSTDFTGNISLAPDAPVLHDAAGNLNWQNNTFINPLGATLIHAQAVTDNLISNLGLNYELLPGLVIRSSLGFTHIQMNQTIQTPLSAYPPSYGNITFLRSNSFGTNDLKNWIIEPQINYVKSIGKNKLEILIGSTFQQNLQNSIGHYASDFSSDALIQNVSAATTTRIAGNNYTKYRYNAIFGRINYNWKEKYLIDLTARRDGSSRFGPGRQFGNFGAVGAAWIFSQEDWIKNSLPFLSFGKIRASYGTTGNDQTPDYQYLSTYQPNYNLYQGLAGLYPTRIPNPDFGWELVRKMELGLETGFMNDRIFFNASYYRNRTGNQLVGYALPNIAGFSSVQYNLPATVQNSGFEFELNTNNIKLKNFTWKTLINLSIPRNKLISYTNFEGSPYNRIYTIGQSLFSRKYYQYTGVDPEIGLYTVRDVNKDGSITYDDRIIAKELTQKFFGGMQNSFSYKGFQLDIFLQFVKQTGNDFLGFFPSVAGFVNQNVPIDNLKRWQTKGDITNIQQFSTGTGPADPARVWYTNSDANIVDASFIRLKNLSVSYALPTNWLQRVHLQNIRIYLQGQNLFTITGYKGLDPETQRLGLPPLRMMTAGIQVSL